MVNTSYKFISFFLVAFLMATSPAVAKRLQARSVGATSVYPFSKKVAELFAKDHDALAPLIISTGTGQGMALFCGKSQHAFSPDFTTASRPIKDKELEMCHVQGVKEILEVPLGYDGIILGIKKDGPLFNVTLEEIFLAASEKVPNEEGRLIQNPYKKWRDINPNLPNIKIQILLPQKKNGTYDAFLELVMDKGCKANEAMNTIREKTGKSYRKLCRKHRRDDHHVVTATKYDLGDSHDLFVQKVYDNPGMLGVMGYGFVKRFNAKIDAIRVGGTSPTPGNIASLEYPLSRPLYIYVHKDRLSQVEGLQDFVNFIALRPFPDQMGRWLNWGLCHLILKPNPKLRS